jgi:DNA-3-methyladenine glycosylase
MGAIVTPVAIGPAARPPRQLRAIPREFFARPTQQVAADLVGTRLLCDAGTDDEVQALVVEVEAYLGLEDPASHAHRGPTPRAAIMFGPPGHLYVYLSYGMHFCANVVCEPEGRAGAVLLRGAAVERGEAAVRRRRGAPAGPTTAALLRGPGNLGNGLGLTLADNGLDLCDPAGRLRFLGALAAPPLAIGPRVGISRAADRPLRFAWADHPAVSRPLPAQPPPIAGPRARGAATGRAAGSAGPPGGGEPRWD